jgi:hypothetical protein
MFDKFASVCRRQAFIDFARKPVVVIQQAFDRLLHKRFRRAALLRRHARQFSLLVRGELHFHVNILPRRYSSCQKGGFRSRTVEKFIGQFKAFSVNLRRLSGWKHRGGHLVVVPR